MQNIQPSDAKAFITAKHFTVSKAPDCDQIGAHSGYFFFFFYCFLYEVKLSASADTKHLSHLF